MPTDLDTTLAALADPARRGVIDLLRDRPRRASDLADELRVSRPAMSRHLRVLRTAGIVDQQISTSDSRVRMVELRKEPFDRLRSWIDEVEEFWADQLDAFKRHAERTTRRKRR